MKKVKKFVILSLMIFILSVNLVSAIDEDVTGDDKVDIDDLVLVGQDFGSSGCVGPTWCGRNDVNQDGVVGLEDMVLVGLAFGWIEPGQSIPVDDCMVLDQENGYYEQQNDIIQDLAEACIVITAKNITFDGKGWSITSNQNFSGVYSDTGETTVKNSNISMGVSGEGIRLYYGGNYAINNTVSGMYGGIYLWYGGNSVLKDNTVYNTTFGLFVSKGSGTVKNNIGYGNTYAIFFEEVTNGKVLNNTLFSNSYSNIYLQENYDVLVENNNLSEGPSYGIYLSGKLSSCLAPIDGCSVNSSNVSIINNIIMGGGHAMLVTHVRDSLIEKNKINSNTIGVFLHFSKNINIFENDIEGGVIVISGSSSSDSYASNNYIFNNTISKSGGTGILVDTAEAIIENNIINDSSIGINMYISSEGAVKNNQVCSNTQDIECWGAGSEIELDNNYCNTGNICGKTCKPCGIFINSCQDLNQPNTVYYLGSNILNNSVVGTCINITAPGITFDCEGNYIMSSSDSIGVYSNQNYTTIKNCEINMGGNGYGIYLDRANYSSLLWNTLNDQGYGIYLDATYSTDVQGNVVKSNNFGISVQGISILGENNNISGNSFCFSTTEDVSCSVDQLEFSFNGCSSGTICGGTCDTCIYDGNTEVNSCGQLINPGTVYTQISDITQYFVGSCIDISASDITFDGNGYTITRLSSLYIDSSVIYYNQLETKVVGTTIGSGNLYGNGIKLENANNSYLFNNKVSDYDSALILEQTSHTQMLENNFSYNAGNAMYSFGGENNSFIRNIILQNEGKILEAYFITLNFFEDNIGEYNDGGGFNLYFGSNNTFIGNNVNWTHGSGVYLNGSNYNKVINNTFYKNYGSLDSPRTNAGVFIENASYNEIRGNYMKSNDYGVGFFKSYNNTVINNSILWGNWGLYLEDSFENNIIQNYIYAHTPGAINLNSGSSNNYIFENIDESSANYKLLISSGSQNNLLVGNSFCGTVGAITCEEPQIFNNNFCDVGTVCGGTCIICPELSQLNPFSNFIETLKGIFNALFR